MKNSIIKGIILCLFCGISLICQAQNENKELKRRDKKTTRISHTPKTIPSTHSASVDLLLTPSTSKISNVIGSPVRNTDTTTQRRSITLSEKEYQSTLLQGYAANEMRMDRPDGIGFRQDGEIITGSTFALYGMRVREEHPNMLTAQRLDIAGSYSLGNFSTTFGAQVNKYYSSFVTTQLGVYGQLSYAFSPNVSATVFGTYYNKNPYFYMATFPYVDTSHYGGYLTIEGNKIGTHLGAEQYYDPFVRKWQFRPIVTPFVKLSKHINLNIEVGGMLKDGADQLIHGNHKDGPMIMPKI